LACLIAVTAMLSVFLAFVAMSFANPQPVVASDQQIVRAIEKTMGKYDFTGNSLRSSMHRDLTAIERAVASNERAVSDVEDAVRDMCNAQPDTSSCGF
jgi:hypothetical protein